MSSYRFTLDPRRGIRHKECCPQCGGRKTYKRYMDAVTGKLLPLQFGRCDRESNCGYHLNPYSEGYAGEILKAEKERGIVSLRSFPFHCKASNKLPPSITYIPKEIFRKSLGGYSRNRFVQYLVGLFGEEKTNELVQRFSIGTSRYWNDAGATVFWLVDTEDRIAGGQVILYDENGNTVKKKLPNGGKQRYNSWVHVALKHQYESQGNPIPNWLSDYIAHSPKYPCLFGLAQLKQDTSTKPVAIVESAKTAIIATAWFPQYTWLAVGSLSYLNAHRLKGLEGRNITLFPDKGGYEKWKEKADELQAIGKIVVSDLLERKEAEQGSDLADYLVKMEYQKQVVEEEEKTDQSVQSPARYDIITAPDGRKVKVEVNEYGYPVGWD
jgi:hypothetical protein